MDRLRKAGGALLTAAWLAGTCLALARCGGDDDLTEVFGTEFLEADMNGASEVPPVETAATGSANFVTNDELNTIGFEFDTQGLQDITAAHIHFGDPTVAGPIIFTLSASSSASAEGLLGSDDLTPLPSAGINSIDEAIDAMIRGETYINVHTATNPAGEIRGQIVER